MLFKKDAIRFTMVDTRLIDPPAYRRNTPRAQLAQLAQSIAVWGVLQPLTVRRQGARYSLISGAMRLEAARIVGVERLPCLVRSEQGVAAEMIRAVENMQRIDPDCFEAAEELVRICRESDLSTERLAPLIGRSKSDIYSLVELCKLSDESKRFCRNTDNCEGFAKALLTLDGEESRAALMAAADQSGFSPDGALRNLRQAQSKPRSERPMLADARLFANTLSRAVELMRRSGIEVSAACVKTGEKTEYLITVSDPRQSDAPAPEFGGDAVKKPGEKRRHAAFESGEYVQQVLDQFAAAQI